MRKEINPVVEDPHTETVNIFWTIMLQVSFSAMDNILYLCGVLLRSILIP